MAAPTNPRNVAALIAYVLGRGAGKAGLSAGSISGLRTAAKGTSRVGAFAGGAAIAAVSGLLHGWNNAKRWKQGKISGGKAIRQTVNESVGAGLATGVGVAAANVVAAGVVAASAVAVVPFLVGAVATTVAKTVWDRATNKAAASGQETRR